MSAWGSPRASPGRPATTSTSSPGPGCSHPRSGPYWQKESDSHEPALIGAGRHGRRTEGDRAGRAAGGGGAESVPALARAGVRVLVEPDAGAAAWFPDGAYERAGAKVASRDNVIRGASALVGVGAPTPELIARLRAGQAVIGMLRPLAEPELAGRLAKTGVTAISLDGLPRTVSRAQSMDALTSQANVAGYKAALIAADHFGRFFPMLITAAGTSRPANVLVLGAGVAGLQAMGTARRLGAVVTGYDIRPETREQIESVGARLL